MVQMGNKINATNVLGCVWKGVVPLGVGIDWVVLEGDWGVHEGQGGLREGNPATSSYFYVLSVVRV